MDDLWRTSDRIPCSSTDLFGDFKISEVGRGALNLTCVCVCVCVTSRYVCGQQSSDELS